MKKVVISATFAGLTLAANNIKTVDFDLGNILSGVQNATQNLNVTGIIGDIFSPNTTFTDVNGIHTLANITGSLGSLTLTEGPATDDDDFIVRRPQTGKKPYVVNIDLGELIKNATQNLNMTDIAQQLGNIFGQNTTSIGVNGTRTLANITGSLGSLTLSEGPVTDDEFIVRRPQENFKPHVVNIDLGELIQNATKNLNVTDIAQQIGKIFDQNTTSTGVSENGTQTLANITGSLGRLVITEGDGQNGGRTFLGF